MHAFHFINRLVSDHAQREYYREVLILAASTKRIIASGNEIDPLMNNAIERYIFKRGIKLGRGSLEGGQFNKSVVVVLHFL